MSHKITIAATILAVMSLAGCATVPMASSQMDQQAKLFQAPPGKANIYVYRNETFGAALKMHVQLDGKPVGETAADTYLDLTVAPGQHKIDSNDGDSVVYVDAKPGQNYFVWQEMKMGLISGHTKLHVVDTATGEKGVGECKLIKTAN